MCVGPNCPQPFGRAQFFQIAAGAALSASLFPSVANASPGEIDPLMGYEPARMTVGNQRAADLARTSQFARANFGAMERMVGEISDLAMRIDIGNLFFELDAPKFSSVHPDDASRTQVRDTLARESFVAAGFRSYASAVLERARLGKQFAPRISRWSRRSRIL